MEDLLEILSNTRWEATHLAIACTWKFVLQNIFKAFQLWKEDKSNPILETILKKNSRGNKEEVLIANVTRT